MTERILFLTGRLAEPQLRRVLTDMAPEFEWRIEVMGVSVAALITADMVRRRLGDELPGRDADWVMVPGRCRGDFDRLGTDIGVRFVRGPEEAKDIPAWFGHARTPPDLSGYNVRIFAEIVDAPQLDVDGIVRRACDLRRDGADVIDLGCLPSTPFPHLEPAIIALKADGFRVSVDSLDDDDLVRAARSGADFLLSLHENNLWIADASSATPVLIPSAHGDLDSLYRAMTSLDARGRAYLVDPILDPIHFGFADSLVRYHAVRRRFPAAEMLMGVGNLTELTHADTAGMNALLLGICSELDIRAILTTQVSAHARRALREADLARRILHYARGVSALPKHIDSGLMALHEIGPFPDSAQEIAELARQIRDPSYRIRVSAEGVHVFNREGLRTAHDPFAFFAQLGVETDGSHAFYLGVELARAQIAWQLGKRYTQDEPLRWGCAAEGVPRPAEADPHLYKPVGPTLSQKRGDA